MLEHNVILNGKTALLAMLVAGSISVLQAAAQSSAPAQPAAPAQSAAPVQSAAPAKGPSRAVAPVHYVPSVSRRAQMYYQGVWGVDSLRVKTAESGELIKFTYRVLDPNKAAALNDKKAEPQLIDPQAGVSLVVPQMEKIGKLRQAQTPEADKSYWMAFSNPGRRVKRGDRVDVVIGQFHAANLVVE